ncbi:MAG: hypothetical protein RIE73_13100 [Coleofasciculus sp. C1-SOL-03]|uniref:hypothetical protein n=1 Tax=Coleofasciculus sp. C1-SOL-03 TaxID=3069522 RepID=UPI0032FB9019
MLSTHTTKTPTFEASKLNYKSSTRHPLARLRVVINSRITTPAPSLPEASLPEANNIGGVTFDKTLNLA